MIDVTATQHTKPQSPGAIPGLTAENSFLVEILLDRAADILVDMAELSAEFSLISTQLRDQYGVPGEVVQRHLRAAAHAAFRDDSSQPGQSQE